MRATARHHGVAYVEAVLATVMVAVLLVPALNALTTGLLGTEVRSELGNQALSLQSKLDEVLAKPYSTLLAETNAPNANSPSTVSAALSDPPGPARRIVTLYRTEGDRVASEADTGLLHIRVAWEGAPSNGGLMALRSKWL